MAFGYAVDAMERLARWDVLPGAQPKEDVEDVHTHSLVHVESAHHGNQQQYYRINYWLVAGGVMLHRVSREGGRSINADCRGVQHTKHILQYTYIVEVVVSLQLPFVYLHTPCYDVVVFFFSL